MSKMKTVLSAGLLILSACLAVNLAHADTPAPPSLVTAHAVRLHPGDDLRKSLVAFAKARNLQAAFVMTVVGSVREARLRMADQHDATAIKGPLEIVSLTGTLDGEACHLHASLSDSTGRTYGGHLVEGCPVYTTAEVVLGEADALRFTREVDPQTTFPELVIRPR